MKTEKYGLTITREASQQQKDIGVSDGEMRWLSIQASECELSVANYIAKFPRWRELREIDGGQSWD